MMEEQNGAWSSETAGRWAGVGQGPTSVRRFALKLVIGVGGVKKQCFVSRAGVFVVE